MAELSVKLAYKQDFYEDEYESVQIEFEDLLEGVGKISVTDAVKYEGAYREKYIQEI